MNLLLVDDVTVDLYPLTLTKPVGALRVGRFTIEERWKYFVAQAQTSFCPAHYLQGKYPATIAEDNICVSGSLIPTVHSVKAIQELEFNQGLTVNGKLVAAKVSAESTESILKLVSFEGIAQQLTQVKELDDVVKLSTATDLFHLAGTLVELDKEILPSDFSKSQPDAHSTIIGEDLHMAEGASISASIINTTSGPVILDKGAQIMEGCIVRGPLYLGEGAVLKMGAKLYGPNIIGPHCKVGGEVNNCYFHSYSNKGHDGFLGNSVIGEWCNLGADTNTSNLKNNYGEVKRWSYSSQSFEKSGLQFCGTVMGDHSKTAINTQLNTGTVLGAYVNVFCADFPPKYMSSFSWFNGKENQVFQLEKAKEAGLKMMERRGVELTPEDEVIMQYLFNERP